MQWDITLFGALSLHDPSGTVPPITHFRTQKGAALLAYLALHGAGRLCAREVIIEAFWPEAEWVAARNRFKQELATLRRQIEPAPLSAGDILEIQGRTHVGLRAGAATTDAARFEQLITQANLQEAGKKQAFLWLQEAVQLHGNHGLLPHLYEEWISGERERLRLLYLSALHRLLKLHTHHHVGEYSTALSAAHSLIALDPIDEQGYVEFIQLLVSHNQPVQARQQLERWRKIAWEKLGLSVDPSLENLITQSEQALPARKRPAVINAITEPNGSQKQGRPAPSLALSAPTVKASMAAPLPISRSRFFGRDGKIAHLLRLLHAKSPARIITLTGPGGAGKTRLAQETARSLSMLPEAERASLIFRGFVPVADITDPAALTNAIFTTLFPTSPQTSENRMGHLVDALLREFVPQAVDGSRQLIILDNLEQIMGDGGVSVLRELTERLPHLICLATSRRSLDMEGEIVIPLEPLPVPSETVTTPSEALQIASVALWVDRARAASPDFQITANNVRDVTAICHLLDGLPLALEIAAARIVSLSPAQMRQTLETGQGENLVSRRRDIPQRHRSLRDTALWSYHLLPDHLQQLWIRLSVFHEGWTLDAAAAVVQQSALQLQNALDELRHHSLIVADIQTQNTGGEEMRFSLLGTLRTFAAEMLGSEEEQTARSRHLAYFLTLVEQADRELRGEREAYWMHRLEAEKPNLRAALRFSLSDTVAHNTDPQNDSLADAALRLCDALAQFWWMRGYIPEGRQWLRRALEASPPTPPRLTRVEALRSAAALALNQDDNKEAHRLASESLVVARRINSPRSIGYAFHTLGRIALNQGDYAMARTHLEQAIALMEELGPQKYVLIANAQAIQRQNLGIALQNLGLPDEASAAYEQAMAHWRSQGMVHRYNIAGLLILQSEAALLQGDLDRARLLASAGLAIQRETQVRGDLDHALRQMGRIEAQSGNTHSAFDAYCESLEVARTSGNRRGTVEAIEAISNLLLMDSSPEMQERGVRLWGWAQIMREQFALPMSPTKQYFWRDTQTRLATQFEAKQRQLLLTEGSLLREEGAIALAKANCDFDN